MEQQQRLTASDFLTWLAKQSGDETYELVDAKVVRMETGTNIHGEIIERLSELLAPIVRAKGCRKYSGSLGVFCTNGDVLVPDLVVTCDERDRPEPGKRGLRYPKLVIEVLSPSNDAATLRRKEDAYCGTPSLEEYVMIDSSRRWAQIWRRNVDGDFVRHPAFASLELETIETVVSLDNLYADLLSQTL